MGDGAGVSARHSQRTVGNGGVLQVGTETVGACPIVASVHRGVGCQLDGTAYAIWAAIVNHGRKQGTISGSTTLLYILEGNITR